MNFQPNERLLSTMPSPLVLCTCSHETIITVSVTFAKLSRHDANPFGRATVAMKQVSVTFAKPISDHKREPDKKNQLISHQDLFYSFVPN